MSALAVLLPDLDRHVARWRRVHDPSGRVGVPAHVTVLVPFVPPARLGRDVKTALRDLFATRPAFDVTFRRTARFPNALWLPPEPHDGFVSLTKAVVARWPEHPPYEGAYAEVIPHATIAYDLTEEEFGAVEAQLPPLLPLAARASEVSLLCGSNAHGWRVVEAFPLGSV